VSNSNDSQTADAAYVDGNFAIPGMLRVTASGGRVLIHIGEAPWLFTVSITQAAAEKFGDALDEVVSDMADGSPFGPVRTFGLVFDDTNRTAGLKLVTE